MLQMNATYCGLLLSLVYSYLAFYIFLLSFLHFSMTTLLQLCVYDFLRFHFIILLSSVVRVTRVFINV